MRGVYAIPKPENSEPHPKHSDWLRDRGGREGVLILVHGVKTYSVRHGLTSRSPRYVGAQVARLRRTSQASSPRYRQHVGLVFQSQVTEKVRHLL